MGNVVAHLDDDLTPQQKLDVISGRTEQFRKLRPFKCSNCNELASVVLAMGGTLEKLPKDHTSRYCPMTCEQCDDTETTHCQKMKDHLLNSCDHCGAKYSNHTTEQHDVWFEILSSP